MTPEKWRRVKVALGEALELKPPDREPYLDRLRREEPDLAEEVERLVRHTAPQTFLETPAAAGVSVVPGSESEAAAAANAEPAGSTIGPFRILGVLGEGGMGVVYRAEQDQPRRIVALKVIRPGYAGEAMLRRFDHEAEALARLQHPGIAQIFQTGTAGEGRLRRPYFAMELVEGRPLTQFAEESHLSVRDRVGLMAQICDAVHHAHAKGVIHRDLKPANILVDTHGRPRILDFGVARVTDSDLRAATIQTDIGQIVGTVPYMSPEQIAGNPGEVDTRSDVYALGVILYELLTGQLPYDLSQKSIIEAARVIRESAPRRLGFTSRTLRGDLETIAGKALEKDKHRRYQSAAELGADLGRLLRREPISARPPSAIYVLRKFAARHRALVAAAGVVSAVVLGALVAVTVQWKRARAEAAKSAATVDFLEQVLTSPDPAKTKGRDVTVREMLDQAAESARESPPAEPEVEVAVLDLIGTSYWKIGVLTKAEETLKAAAKAAEQRLGPDSPLRYNALNTLGLVYVDQGRTKEAGELIMQSYQADLRLLGENHKDTLSSMNNAVRWLGSEGRYDEAIPLMQRAVELRTKMFGPDHQRTLISVDNLGRVLFVQGRAADAEPYFRRAIAGFQRTLGPDDPDTLVAKQNLCEALRKLNRLDEAEPLERTVVEARRRVLSDDNPFTLSAINYLGRILMDQGKPDLAEPLLRESVERAERTLGHDHQYTVGWRIPLGTCMGKLNRFPEAEAMLLDTYRGATTTPDNAGKVKPTVEALVALYESAGRADEAAAWRAKAPAGK